MVRTTVCRAEWVIERVAAIDVVKAAGKVCVGGSFTTRCRRRALRCSWSCPGCDECAGPAQDKLDAVSLAELTEKGLLRSSFVPPAEIRRLRDDTRLREDVTRDRTRYWQRLESPGRARPPHPGHRLAPAGQPGRPLP
ncbi:IS110 family transposase [Mycobacterium riyadhense]|uniref:IS110 family transposase n=1 Tax=Mycobacterium riyadhense TaxID=486698 RepID=UPI001EF9F419|nr:transposase [Mycobacterium riyadhense]